MTDLERVLAFLKFRLSCFYDGEFSIEERDDEINVEICVSILEKINQKHKSELLVFKQERDTLLEKINQDYQSELLILKQERDTLVEMLRQKSEEAGLLRVYLADKNKKEY